MDIRSAPGDRYEHFAVNQPADRVAAYVTTYPNGATLNQILIYQLTTGALLQTITPPAAQTFLCFTPDAQYAWIATNPGQGQIARMNLTTQQLDQTIQFPAPGPYGGFTAQVDPTSQVLVVQASPCWGTPACTTVHVYLNGSLLQNTPAVPIAYPLIFDNQGRLLTSNGSGVQACEIDPAQGLVNCVTVLPQNPAYPLASVGDALFIQDGTVISLGTGQTLAIVEPISGVWLDAAYLASSNHLLANLSIIDVGTYDILVNLQNEIPDSIIESVWAPDWAAIQTSKGLLVGEIPQLLPAPAFSLQGVVNAASSVPATLSPGEIISIFGTNLGPSGGHGPVAEEGLFLSTSVSDTQVIFNGVPGAVLYTGSDQINVVVPEIVSGEDSVTMQVTRYDIPSARVALPTADFQPAIFAYPLQGQFYAAALSANGAIQGPGNPLTRGSTVAFYATGLGLPAGATSDSVPVRAATLPVTPTVTIGGVTANVVYAGAAPGETAGVTQLNVSIPANAPVGGAIEVVLSIGSQSEGNVWVAIQ